MGVRRPGFFNQVGSESSSEDESETEAPAMDYEYNSDTVHVVMYNNASEEEIDPLTETGDYFAPHTSTDSGNPAHIPKSQFNEMKEGNILHSLLLCMRHLTSTMRISLMFPSNRTPIPQRCIMKVPMSN